MFRYFKFIPLLLCFSCILLTDSETELKLPFDRSEFEQTFYIKNPGLGIIIDTRAGFWLAFAYNSFDIENEIIADDSIKIELTEYFSLSGFLEASKKYDFITESGFKYLICINAYFKNKPVRLRENCGFALIPFRNKDAYLGEGHAVYWLDSREDLKWRNSNFYKTDTIRHISVIRPETGGTGIIIDTTIGPFCGYDFDKEVFYSSKFGSFYITQMSPYSNENIKFKSTCSNALIYQVDTKTGAVFKSERTIWNNYIMSSYDFDKYKPFGLRNSTDGIDWLSKVDEKNDRFIFKKVSKYFAANKIDKFENKIIYGL